MKKATCKSMGGACDVEITGKTAEAMGEACKAHVMEKVNAGDEFHKAAIEQWKTRSEEENQKWYADFKNNFEKLPDA